MASGAFTVAPLETCLNETELSLIPVVCYLSLNNFFGGGLGTVVAACLMFQLSAMTKYRQQKSCN